LITLTENAKNYLTDIKKDDYITLGVTWRRLFWISVRMGL